MGCCCTNTSGRRPFQCFSNPVLLTQDGRRVRNPLSRNHGDIGKHNSGNMVWPRIPGLQRKHHPAEAKHKNKLKNSRQCQNPSILTEKGTGCIARPTLIFAFQMSRELWPLGGSRRDGTAESLHPACLSWLPHPGNEVFIFRPCSQSCILFTPVPNTCLNTLPAAFCQHACPLWSP